MTKSEKFTRYSPDEFKATSQLPDNDAESKEWQRQNMGFWEKNPMRYDFSEAISSDEFSESFFNEIDSRFFGVVSEFMPWQRIPFERYIPYATLGSLAVLEIGVGNGSHAQLIAEHCENYNGIDITDYAITSTTNRFKLKGLQRTLTKMDAEHLQYADEYFDFIWSWGVIHHSADTGTVVTEMNRVLKPGGRATIMVYYKGWWNYYFVCGVIHGLIRGKYFKYRSLHKIAQSQTDGAIARYYSFSSWKDLVRDEFRIDSIQVEGAKTDLIPLPKSKIKRRIQKVLPNIAARFMTSRLRMGSLLVVEMTKK